MNVNELPPRKQRAPRGQGMTENIITVALVAIAAIGVVTLFGDNIRSLFGVSADALAGETAVANRAVTSVGKLENKGLKDFAENNSPAEAGAGNGGAGPNAQGTF